MSNSQSAIYVPSVNLFGSGSVNEVGVRLADLGAKKTLLVTDDGLYKLGLADRIAGIIREAGVEVAIFPKAEPNPTDLNVAAGLEAFQAEKCDSLVTLGGGSSHDCGKGVGLVAANGGRIHDYEGVDVSAKPMVTLVAINTTAGTGSEVTRFTIITDTSRSVKMAIVDKHVTPTLSINDPDLMLGLPPGLTASTGMDALTHAVEAYVSTAATPITDALAIQAIKIIPKWLPKAVANGSDLEAREQMVFAQSLAGMAFNNASLGYVHAIAHQFGGFYNYAHGVCNAILLPHVCKYNLLAKEEKFAEIAVALGVNVDGLSTREAAEKGIAKIEQMSKDLNIPGGFAQLGAKEEDIETLATNAMKDACALTNPRKAKVQDIIDIIKGAM
jgi:alcohol dehydrogenase